MAPVINMVMMPVLLLFLAAYTRIAAYGLTEQRYLIVLIGVWALILAILRISRPDRFDLRVIPGTLAISSATPRDFRSATSRSTSSRSTRRTTPCPTPPPPTRSSSPS